MAPSYFVPRDSSFRPESECIFLTYSQFNMSEETKRKIELRVSNHKAYVWDVDGMSCLAL